MRSCETCRHTPNEERCRWCRPSTWFIYWEPKTQTNADKIRSMTDEELADLYMRAIDDGEYPAYWGFKTGLLIWLKSPADKEVQDG